MDFTKPPKKIQWNESWSTGNDLMDSQHKSLVSLINDLNSTLYRNTASKDEIEILFGKIKDYTVYHFKSEEKLLAKYNYPDLENHKKIHQHFIEQINIITGKFSSAGMGILPILINFLNIWVKDHILGVDRKYSSIVGSRDKPD